MSYKKLSEVDIDDLIEKKGYQKYLSWANAWKQLKSIYPNATRTVYENDMGLPYFTDGNTSLVKVGVTIGDIEHIDYLAIMDHKNKSIRFENMTSFDVIKTIQRSTVKAIAWHGLGLELWIGEDTKISKAKEEEGKEEKIPLNKGDKNWKKIVPWIEKMKGKKTKEQIVSTISDRYIITPQLIKHIENECN
tara:strand:- start:1137 stop:1709 length:573 start_codon:yes stop_codon:yes gene_type:complete